MWILVAVVMINGSQERMIFSPYMPTVVECIKKIEPVKQELAKKYPKLIVKDVSCWPIEPDKL